MQKYVVGVDLGGTKIASGRCGLDGEVLSHARVATNAGEGLEAVVGRMVESVIEALGDADLAGLIGVGVGTPGIVDSRQGVVANPSNLAGWDEVPLRDMLARALAQRLGRAVRVELANDANAAALGEFRFGAGRDHPGLRHMTYITVSTGIGGGVIAEGKIFEGAHGAGGEVGHMTIDVNGRRCACGNVGCVETLAAGPAIARAGAELVRAGKAPVLAQLAGNDPAAVTTALVEQAARQNDTDAIELMQQVGLYLGVMVVNVLHLFNPQMVVIGGGVSKMGDLIFDPINKTVQSRALAVTKKDLVITRAVLGDSVGLLGAASLLL